MICIISGPCILILHGPVFCIGAYQVTDVFPPKNKYEIHTANHEQRNAIS